MQLKLRTQRGVSIIEALVAFLILSMGLLAFARIQSELRFATDVSRQRAEAVRLAQENMEKLRAYIVLPANGAGTTPLSFDEDIVQVTAAPTTLVNVNTEFRLTRTVNTVTGDMPYKSLAVNVSWEDRRGETQSVTLNSGIARLDPTVSGKLALRPPARTNAKKPMDRDARIPIDAVDLGDNKSGFLPPGQSDFFWVFDSDSANILKKCYFDPSSAAADRVVRADVYAAISTQNRCVSRPGYLLKGFIRFDLSNPVVSRFPDGTACDFYARVRGTGNGVTEKGNVLDCSGVASPVDLLGVTMPDPGTGYSPGNNEPRYECFDDFTPAVKENRGFVNYYCAIYVQNEGGSWSGKSELTHTAAWDFGTEATDIRNCRYSADYSGNGEIDPWEHPYSYSNVKESLTAQSFLLIPGNVTCPGVVQTINATDITVDFRTCRHQPAPSNTSQTPTQAAGSCER